MSVAQDADTAGLRVALGARIGLAPARILLGLLLPAGTATAAQLSAAAAALPGAGVVAGLPQVPPPRATVTLNLSGRGPRAPHRCSGA